MTTPRIKPVRRIVTGHRNGKSVILEDGASPHSMALQGVPNFGVTDLWKTLTAPADNNGYADPCGQPITLAPPECGTVFRMVEFPPDKEYVGRWKREEAFGSLGESGAEAVHHDGSRHEGMHRTRSVDYAFVMSGEIWAVMDEGEVLMKAGDVLIQRGTNHSWSNRSDEPAVVGFVLIDAKAMVE